MDTATQLLTLKNQQTSSHATQRSAVALTCAGIVSNCFITNLLLSLGLYVNAFLPSVDTQQTIVP